MRYNQVKDLVEWAAGFHARMARQFSEAAEQADNERLKMGLDYLDAKKTATLAHERLQAMYEHRALRSRIAPEAEFFDALAEGQNSEIRHMMASMEELQGV